MKEHVAIYTDLVPTSGPKPGSKIAMDLSDEELEELNGYVAAVANHAEERKVETVLERVFFRFEKALQE